METLYLIVSFGLFFYFLGWFIIVATLKIGQFFKGKSYSVEPTTHLIMLTITAVLFFGAIINYIQGE